MVCVDLVVLVCLLMACGGTAEVFAQRRQELNGRCLIYSECNTIGYFCSSNRTCQCGPGYYPNKERTKCIGFIGSKCYYDSHCLEGAFCTGPEGWEVCRCKTQEGFYASDDNTFCISFAERMKSHHLTISLLVLVWTTLYLNT